MKSFLPPAVLLLGVVLLIGSALWAIIFPASRGWTEEKSAQLTKLGDQASQLKLELTRAQAKPNMHGGRNPAELQAEFEKVDAEYTALYAEFQGHTKSPETASRILRWSGIAFIVAGGLIVFANRSA